MIKGVLRNFLARFYAPGFVAACSRRPKSRPLNWADCRRVLVIKLDEIGDFVLATPFLRELRRNAPKAHITLVVRPHVLPLAETCPYVDRVCPHNPQTKGLSLWQLRQQWRALRKGITLRHHQLDLAIIPRLGEDAYAATYLARYTGARMIVGYTERASIEKQAMNPGYDKLLTHAIDFDNRNPIHEIAANLRLLTHFGAQVLDDTPELWLRPEDLKTAKTLIDSATPFVAVATGAVDPKRRWPAERFEKLTTWLKQHHGLDSVLLGLAGDPFIGATVDLRGRTTLREAAAILSKSRLFVGNDSGLKHIATAMKIPVVEINSLRPGTPPMHNNSAVRFGALQKNARIVQPPPGIGESAIDEVSLQATQEACEELLTAQP